MHRCLYPKSPSRREGAMSSRSGAFRAKPVRCLAVALLFIPLTFGAAPPAKTAAPANAKASLPNPILFVTQVPVPADFTTVASVFGNHRGDMESAARGGGLWIRYPDGVLRNLTREAGFGTTGFQGANSIAVREPSVHWSGRKALFSMVIGAPTE